jgi:uncharacterized cofD-like protein
VSEPARDDCDDAIGGLHPGGARVVAIGGGHGLARSLGAARRYAGAITAVVSVADDGGSSGRLREALGIPAPGDLRRCIGALLPAPSPLGDALEHRFVGGDLAGHAFGNLLIAALSAATGSFLSGIEETCRLLATVGTVLPASEGAVVLRAEAECGDLAGQVRIMESSGIRRVSLDPPDACAPDGVLAAIADAQQLLIGPGSLYTSVLAALAPGGIAEAVAACPGRVVYLANLHEQIPETAGYDVGRHLDALRAHRVRVDVVLADESALRLGRIPPGVEVCRAPLATGRRLEHDEALTAVALQALLA